MNQTGSQIGSPTQTMSDMAVHPHHHAKTQPDHPAFIMAATGEAISYAELDSRANQIAHLLRSAGLQRGDGIALFMDNKPAFLEICWGAQRAGVYYTPMSTRLTPPEAAYIINDCNAKMLFVSDTLQSTASQIKKIISDNIKTFCDGTPLEGFENYLAARQKQPTHLIKNPAAGADMLYSSGTTGRPKGVRRPLPEEPFDEPGRLLDLLTLLYQFSPEITYLSPAPLYHAAPLRFTMGAIACGGTAIIMEHFDPEETLRLIEKYKITHSQFVPTMFVRMLKMPDDIRAKYDLSSMKIAIHAAAPCPIEIKHKMIQWWGPVICEYYAGTEGNGFCAINAEQWLEHEGSVGPAITGILHICDKNGSELPPRQEGLIYFENENEFSYHNDPDKTQDSRHPQHEDWSTLGDIGWLDEDGFLYLTDRRAHMIISGGVNIYPQEAENILINHPKVADVAVIGVPNEEFGEEVKAVVQPARWEDASPDTEAELIAYCQKQLSSIKCPKSVDFERELPRHATGKLYKRLLRDRYWGHKQSKIV